MKTVFALSAIGLLSLLTTSCATILNGTTQTIPINSTPSGASIQVGEITGTTPTTMDLKRSTPHLVKITKDGYHPATLKLEQVMSGAVLGNLGAGGLIGWGVDAATGAQYRLVPETIDVTLTPLPAVVTIPVPPITTLETLLNEVQSLQTQGLISTEEALTRRGRLLARTQ